MISRLALATLLAVALAARAGDVASEIEFRPPTELYGDVTVEGQASAAISGQGCRITLTGKEIVLHERETVAFLGGGEVVARTEFGPPIWRDSGSTNHGHATLEASESWGIKINGFSTWESKSAAIQGTVEQTASPSISPDYTPYPQIASSPTTDRFSAVMTGDDVVALSIAGTFSLELFGISGHVFGDSNHAVASGYNWYETTPTGDKLAGLRYVKIDVLDGRLDIQTERARIAWLAPASHVIVDGIVTIPLVSGSISTGNQLPNGTWRIAGLVELAELRPLDQGLVASRLSSLGARYQIDGQEFFPEPSGSAYTAAATVGIVALVMLAIKAIPPVTHLLTRLPPEKALENANRKSLHEYIQGHPGATFREILRGTDMAAGTARHHLTVLARSRVIVEHGHRSTRRFFENHGKFDGTWQSVVLLREPELQQVYSWLEGNEDANQKDLLAHAEFNWRWSRSTTQHRLARLIDGGLVTYRHAGRRKFYRAVPADEAVPTPGHKASWT